MKYIRNIKIVFTLLLFTSSALDAAQIVGFNTTSLVGYESDIDANVLASGLHSAVMARGPGIPNPSPPATYADTFAAVGWDLLSLAEAISENQYFSITIMPEIGSSIDFSSLIFNWKEQNLSNSPAMTYAVFAGPVGFAVSDAIAVVDYTPSFAGEVLSSGTIDLSTYSALQGVTSAVEFRVYGWGCAAYNGTGGFTGTSAFSVEGTVQAIPEPSSLALLFAFIAGGIALWFLHGCVRARVV